MFTRRLWIEYLLMVGVPVILLAGVLHRGRTLEAPAEIQGDWILAFSGETAPEGSCAPRVQKLDGSEISIAQSGSYLTATLSDFGPNVLKGRSEGSALWLESIQRNDPALDRDQLRLTGTVSSMQDGKMIRGTLLMPRSVDCPPLAFEATWQSGAAMRPTGVQH